LRIERTNNNCTPLELQARHEAIAVTTIVLLIVSELLRGFVIGAFCEPATIPDDPGIVARPPESHARDPPTA
jgi:hypothetical protein